MQVISRRVVTLGTASILAAGLTAGVTVVDAAAAPAKARERTLVYVTSDFPYNFVVVKVRGKKVVGVAGTLGSGDFGCVRGTTRSGKLRAPGLTRAVGRGSGSSFRYTKFYDYGPNSTIIKRALVPTTIARLNQLSGMPQGDRSLIRAVKVCRSGGAVGEP